MAKDKTDSEKRERKEAKKDKKRKAEDEGAADETPRKEKKSKRKSEVAGDADNMDVDTTELVTVEGASSNSATVLAIPLAALVPFANPLADDKSQKKVLKSVKKGASTSPIQNSTCSRTNVYCQQPPKPNPSNAASKNASKPSANPPPQPPNP